MLRKCLLSWTVFLTKKDDGWTAGIVKACEGRWVGPGQGWRRTTRCGTAWPPSAWDGPFSKDLPTVCLLKRQAVSWLSILEELKTEVLTDISVPHPLLWAQTTIKPLLAPSLIPEIGFILMCGRDQHSIVKQLSSNKTFLKISFSYTYLSCCCCILQHCFIYESSFQIFI